MQDGRWNQTLDRDHKGIKSTIQRHPSKEIRTGTLHSILKELGISLK
jgi:predicted RNA binding protein YcfA (HicA-like mRNA interferase family)